MSVPAPLPAPAPSVTDDNYAAWLCWAIHTDPSAVAWDHYDDGTGPSGVCWGAVRVGDDVVVVDRGSTSLLDWVRDAEAFADPFVHDGLGPVHPGFLRGVEAQRDQVVKLYPAPGVRHRRFVGHSLGAARASLLTGLFVLAGGVPLPRCVMGEPCSTFEEGASIIARAGGTSYRNGDGVHHDPVTSVPVRFWPELYQHATRLTDVCEPPSPDDDLGPFAWHHDFLYVRGIQRSTSGAQAGAPTGGV